MQVLSLTSKAYHVQSKGAYQNTSASPLEYGSNHIEGTKVQPQSIISLFESQWSTIQMVVLREILMSSVRAGDPISAWSAAARLLRFFYPLITPAGQSGLASSLTNSSERLPPGTRCADPALPFVRLHSFTLHPCQVDIIKRNPEKKEWWTGSGPSGPFIYTPFSKGVTTDNKQSFTWIVGEPIQVLVELANPCGFDLVVESIYLSVHSDNLDAFPVSVSLPPNTSKVIVLSGIPTKVGSVSIPGCIVHCFGVITEHLFKEVDNLLLGAAQGLVLSDPFRSCGSTKHKHVPMPSISIAPALPLVIPRVIGGEGASVLYEGEIRDLWISLTNAGSVQIDQAHISLSGKNQDSVIRIAHDTLREALPLKPGAEVLLPITVKAWQLNLVDSENDSGRGVSENLQRVSKDGSSPLLIIHYAGPLSSEHYSTEFSVPPGRRLTIPLQVSVLQGLRFVRARLLSMEIPKNVSSAKTKNEESTSYGKDAKSVKCDPHKENRGLHLLELELSNPTDVVFEVNVTVQGNSTVDKEDHNTVEFGYTKTRIDRDYSSRVLIPLEHFKSSILDKSMFSKDKQSNTAEWNTKAEVNASINNLISKIKVRWQSGRNSSGELNIREAIQSALQSSVMDILLPDPLTYEFRLAASNAESDSISAHEMTNIEVYIRNNTRETIQMCLSVTCKDVASNNCTDGANATVLWAGILNGISLKVPPLEEVMHQFSLYFLVPGEYSLLPTAVIDEPADVLRAYVRTDSTEGPIICRGSPFHFNVKGTV